MRLNSVVATFLFASSLTSFSSFADEVIIEMKDLSQGHVVGRIIATDTEFGTVFQPMLEGVAPGLYGFHVHTNPSCEPLIKDGKTILGGAAGGHLDPHKTNKHGFPWSKDNHLGDLPPLYVDHAGSANQPVLAPRIKVEDLKSRSLMIHVGGDNHSDHPAPLGGGGARMVCGVIR
ncbi:superoxide dismutase family protein [Vibrio parahaemolyticus]|nr:superoxide dismutase family protein [Vibrio parahaemolyticus]